MWGQWKKVRGNSYIAFVVVVVQVVSDCSMPDFPVFHYLPEFAQTYVRWVGDAIQPSHLLSYPSPPASILPSIRVFSNESALYNRWPKYWSFSFSISPSNEYWGWFPLGLTGLISFLSNGLSSVFSSTTVWKHQFFGRTPWTLHLLFARYSSDPNVDFHFHLHNNPMWLVMSLSSFSGWTSRVQRSKVIYPRSHSWKVYKLDFRLSLLL